MALARIRGWRQAIASLALIFFAFQGYLTQTHIHLLWQGAPGVYAQRQTAKPAPTPNQFPPADDPANCPICQDMLLAGHFTTPGAIIFMLPDPIAIPIAIAREVSAVKAAVSHSWQGRAPPAH